MSSPSSTLTEEAAREQLCSTYRRIEQSGLSAGAAGNISVLLGDRMLISPTGADGASVRPEDFVLTGLDGVAQSAGAPSSEWAIHSEIYKAGLGKAVIHAHPDYCVALSCLRKPIPPFHYMIASFGGSDIPCAPYAPFGTVALAQSVIASLRDRSACLMANHGMVCHAETLSSALAKTSKLEMLARQYCIAVQAGSVVLLDDADMAVVKERYRDYARRGTGVSK